MDEVSYLRESEGTVIILKLRSIHRTAFMKDGRFSEHAYAIVHFERASGFLTGLRSKCDLGRDFDRQEIIQ